MSRYIIVLAMLGTCGDLGCGSSTPSATDQAAVGAYGTALQGCIATAKMTDGGLPAYEACARTIDGMFGLAPKDGGK
jgi:hypothetical protein